MPPVKSHPPDENNEEYVDRKLSSDFTLHSTRQGFFKDYLDVIDYEIPQEFIDRFADFKTDEDKVIGVWRLKSVHKVTIKSSYKGKDRKKSEVLRNEGNKSFQEKKDEDALSLYSQAVMLAPTADGEGEEDAGDCLSLSYANRSAVLYRLGDYDLCLEDIQLAIDAGYPKKLMYKILDRKGQCLMKLNQYNKAEKAFETCLEALSASGLEAKVLQRWKEELAKKKQSCAGKTDEGKPKSSPPCAKVYGEINQALPSASSAVTVHQSEMLGRYAVAKDPIPAGEILLTERPYATAMKAEMVPCHCYACFNRLVAPVACPWCSAVAFCSSGCRALAVATHHRWECKFLMLLEESGMSLNCYLALRIITQHGLEFFKKIQPRLRESDQLPTSKSPRRPNDYVSVYRMVGLEEQRPQNNFIPFAVMAAFLLKVLQRANFFGDWKGKGAQNDLTEDEAFIGGLLLRNLQVVQFNSHEVSGIELTSGTDNLRGSRSVYLGIGVYPTAALCNHACYPSVTRYFEGTKLVLVSLRPLEAGDALAENYGPIFTKNKLQERQKILQSKYWFNCTCDACLEKWPLYDDFSSSARSLRCQKCGSALPSRIQAKSHVTCKTCGTSNDVTGIFNTLKEADKYYEEGKKHFMEGKREEVITSFVKYIELAYKLLVLPTFEIFTAFDCLRMTFAARSTIQVKSKANPT